MEHGRLNQLQYNKKRSTICCVHSTMHTTFNAAKGKRRTPNNETEIHHQLLFLRRLINWSVFRPDPNKVDAILQLPPTTDVQELERILGMVNYLGRYIPKLSTVGQPLYELLKNKNAWTWSHAQQAALPDCNPSSSQVTQYIRVRLIKVHDKINSNSWASSNNWCVRISSSEHANCIFFFFVFFAQLQG